MNDLKQVGKGIAYIVGRNNSFDVDVSSGQRTDVINSLVLAQSASDKKYDPEKEIDNWISHYLTILNQIGWDSQGLSFLKQIYLETYFH